jgi:hypothetical protein
MGPAYFSLCPSYHQVQIKTILKITHHIVEVMLCCSQNWLRAGRSGDRIPVGTRFSKPVQIVPGVHLASFTMVTGSFPGVKRGWGVTMTPHPLLVLSSSKLRAIPLFLLWAVRPVQSLSACTRVHLSFYLIVVKDTSKYLRAWTGA